MKYILFIFMLIFIGCKEESTTPKASEGQSLKILKHSDCGGFQADTETDDGQTCIQYEYDGSDILLISHLNAGFNCCPDDFNKISLDVHGNTITLDESEVDGDCDCECLFDINFKLTGIQPGTYHFIVNEALSPKGDALSFDMDLSTKAADIYCVERLFYPWNLE